MEEKTNNWGGKREGAGRKRKAVKNVGFRATPEVAAILDMVENRTDFISEAIVKLAKEKGLI